MWYLSYTVKQNKALLDLPHATIHKIPIEEIRGKTEAIRWICLFFNLSEEDLNEGIKRNGSE